MAKIIFGEPYQVQSGEIALAWGFYVGDVRKFGEIITTEDALPGKKLEVAEQLLTRAIAENTNLLEVLNMALDLLDDIEQDGLHPEHKRRLARLHERDW